MLTIKTLRTLVAPDDGPLPEHSGDAFFAECLAHVSPQPDLVVHVISSEVDALAEADIRRWSAKAIDLFPDAQHGVVGLGCLGLYAALQHVQHTGAASALLLVMEAPACHVQAKMDQIGMGSGNNGDGMVVQESLACMHIVTKDAHQVGPADIWIEMCKVLSKPQGFSGPHRLLNKIGALLEQELKESLHLVSFDAGSRWAKKLVGWFAREITPLLPQAFQTLPSSEAGPVHRLSTKPALEINQYLRILDEHGSLAVSSIGAGGRFALLKLRRGALPVATHRFCSPFPVDREPVMFHAGSFSFPKEAGLLFMDGEHGERDDVYYHWPIQLIRHEVAR